MSKILLHFLHNPRVFRQGPLMPKATFVNHSLVEKFVFPNKFIPSNGRRPNTDASCGQKEELVAFRMRLSIW